MTQSKLIIDTHIPTPNQGIESRTTKTANMETWLKRNLGLPEGTRVTIHTPTGGTLQYRLVRHQSPLWILDRRTYGGVLDTQ
jgi:SMC interacting uncharacterized protein involved in chromosome segregation